MRPAAAEVGMAQAAALVGSIGITFLRGAVPAGLMLAWTMRTRAPLLVALLLFALHAGFGLWRIATSPRAVCAWRSSTVIPRSANSTPMTARRRCT